MDAVPSSPSPVSPPPRSRAPRSPRPSPSPSRPPRAWPFPLAGRSVTVAIGTNPGGGTLSGTTTANTDASGVATFAGLSIDKSGAGYTLGATSSGLTSATSTTFTVTHAAASELVVSPASITRVASATPNSGTITVTRQDTYGNAVTTGSTTVALTSTSGGATAVFSATSLTVAASATFSYGNTKVGTWTVSAAALGLTSGSLSATIHTRSGHPVGVRPAAVEHPERATRSRRPSRRESSTNSGT